MPYFMKTLDRVGALVSDTTVISNWYVVGSDVIMHSELWFELNLTNQSYSDIVSSRADWSDFMSDKVYIEKNLYLCLVINTCMYI